MISANFLLMLVLTAGPTVPSDKDYWQGYASSVISGPIVLQPVGAGIYEGKPKPKKDTVTQPVEIPKVLPPPVTDKEPAPAKEPEVPPVPPKVEVPPAPKPEVPPAPVPKEDVPPPPVEPTKSATQETNTPLELPLPNTFKETIDYLKKRGCLGLVVFSTQQCDKCDLLINTTLKDRDVKAALQAKGVGLIQKLDCDIETAIADHFKIKNVPWYILTDGKTVIKTGEGYLIAPDFLKWLQ